MIYFSHRGNLTGPQPDKENAPDYIDKAIAAGFSVEIDLRMIGDQLYLGHDFPQYPVSKDWIDKRFLDLAIHLKDLESLQYVIRHWTNWHHFCHQSDAFTMTSWGLIWLHDIDRPIDRTCIIPLLSADSVESYRQSSMYGVCSDYIIMCQRKFSTP